MCGIEPVPGVAPPAFTPADRVVVQADHGKRVLSIDTGGRHSALGVRGRAADGIKRLLAGSIHWASWGQVPPCALVAAIAIDPPALGKDHQPRMLNTEGSVNKIHGSSNTIHVVRTKLRVLFVFVFKIIEKRDPPLY